MENLVSSGKKKIKKKEILINLKELEMSENKLEKL